MGNTNYWFIKTFVEFSGMCTFNYKKFVSQTIKIFSGKWTKVCVFWTCVLAPRSDPWLHDFELGFTKYCLNTTKCNIIL